MTTATEITREDVEKLKQDWLNDPCWDIEHTEGFEAFHDELLEYRKGKEAEWEERRYRKIQARALEMGVSVETMIGIQSLEYTVAASKKRVSRMLFQALNIDIEEAEGLVDDLTEVAIASIKIDLLKSNPRSN